MRYGFEVAASWVGWVPYVGWLAGQIMIFYNFGESIVASIVFNFTDWLRGNGGIARIGRFGVESAWRFLLDSWLNWPLPPIPCARPPSVRSSANRPQVRTSGVTTLRVTSQRIYTPVSHSSLLASTCSSSACPFRS